MRKAPLELPSSASHGSSAITILVAGEGFEPPTSGL
jgi:hypothetical protein